jgi:TrmH family RNA methyltransferase
MLTKQDKKLIRSLAIKKYRDREGLFVVEGEKSVGEFVASGFGVRKVYHTSQYRNFPDRHTDRVQITMSEMQQITNLKTASPVLAIVEIPSTEIHSDVPRKELVLALDGVQDPGNLGTIIRLADWFGINHVVCSPFTADVYGPKTVQATMGSLTRVKVVYSDLCIFLKSLKNDVPVCGAFLNGENIYETTLPSTGVVVMGNEGNGISPQIAASVSKKLFIPPFGNNPSESLNVAVATAIVCSEFRRRHQSANDHGLF